MMMIAFSYSKGMNPHVLLSNWLKVPLLLCSKDNLGFKLLKKVNLLLKKNQAKPNNRTDSLDQEDNLLVIVLLEDSLVVCGDQTFICSVVCLGDHALANMSTPIIFVIPNYKNGLIGLI